MCTGSTTREQGIRLDGARWRSMDASVEHHRAETAYIRCRSVQVLTAILGGSRSLWGGSPTPCQDQGWRLGGFLLSFPGVVLSMNVITTITPPQLTQLIQVDFVFRWHHPEQSLLSERPRDPPVSTYFRALYTTVYCRCSCVSCARRCLNASLSKRHCSS